MSGIRPRHLGRWRLAAVSLSLLLSLGAAPGGADEPPKVAEGSVAPGLDRRQDQRIEERLRATFAALDELTAVAVAVEAGIVRLTGEVDSMRAAGLATQLAQQVEGVSAVESEIEETRSVARRLALATERLEKRAWGLVDRLPLMVVAIVLLLFALWIARLIAGWDGLFGRVSRNVFIQDLARQATRLAIVGAGVLVALEVLDATGLVGAIAGAAGIVGLALGFAFRDLVENYIASILLSLRQPFAPGDHVRIDAHEGRVARLTSRATIIVTFDGNHVRVPNGVVFKAVIENYTRKPERRFEFEVGVDVDADLVEAQTLGREVLDGMPGVLEEPGPSASIVNLGDSTVVLRFYGWVDQRAVDFLKVRSEAIRLVKRAFDEANIEMPEPIQRVRVEPFPKAGAAGAPEAGAASPKPSDPEDAEVQDISIDRHVEALVAQERAGTDDLLSENAPTE